MNRSAAHTALCKRILVALGSEPGTVVGLNPIGLARYVSDAGREFFTPYGWPCKGGPDILGAVAPHGRLFGLEVKTGKATQTPEQKSVAAALRALGVVVEAVRSVDEACAVVSKARAA